ncbi:hypothetical protein, partial [Streptomyces sp. FH025]|uniref:hypothetical protein n=1 Tax=Streptomyces sp. FH025 TaxID=2815937 RepID=UPI001A9F3402
MGMLLTGAAGGLLLPAGLVVLFFLGAVARRLRSRPAAGPAASAGGRGAGASATEELHALLYPSKRVQLEQRRIELALRD